MGKKRIDLTGQRFGRLVVISLNEEVSKQKKCSYWNCKCDCGNETIVIGAKKEEWILLMVLVFVRHAIKNSTKSMVKGNNTEQQYIEFKEEKQKNMNTNSINCI